jgi:aspartyl-tRNA(Asn)/glutamyl-tRNA(Gln) amidotransferase subunit A
MLRSPKRNDFLRKDRHIGWIASRMIPAADYLKAQRIRVEIMQYASELFKKYSALVTPSWMGTAWEWDKPESGPTISPVRGNPADPDNGPRISTFSNLVGIPAISVPCGFTESGLPLGLQFVGAAFDEVGILQLAQAYEQATEWHKRHPTLT